MTDQPEFEAPALSEIVRAIRKRSKALKRSFSEIGLEKVHDDAHSPPMECLNVSLRIGPSPSGPRIKLRVWADRWAWVDARQPSKKGWLWASTSEGRIAGGKTGADFVSALESFYTLLPDRDHSGDIEGARRIWDKLLLPGTIRSVN